MARWRWLWIPAFVCLFSGGCDKHPAKKPDPTKGTVTGIVLCADTGKPARFATVTLSAAPRKDGKAEKGAPLPDTESTMTDLEGRFRLEAVEPGEYYAFATMNGYLNPMRGLDFSRLDALGSNQEQELDAIKQWKDHLTEVAVRGHHTADVSLEIERGAEISGTVTYDDASPAIGMHFQLFRKGEKSGWSEVGPVLYSNWEISEVSDSHGHFNLTNLSAGEYTVCAQMPTGAEGSAPRVCLGNTFRMKDAKTVKVRAGEISSGADIEIPLSGLHTIAGSVTDAADSQPLLRGTVRLLYADDREKARETQIGSAADPADDGDFSFAYVSEGKYILQVSVPDADAKDVEAGPGNSEGVTPAAGAVRHYANKEFPLTVLDDDVDDIHIQLDAIPPDKRTGPEPSAAP
jgi:hypothetical protein